MIIIPNTRKRIIHRIILKVSYFSSSIVKGFSCYKYSVKYCNEAVSKVIANVFIPLCSSCNPL